MARFRKDMDFIFKTETKDGVRVVYNAKISEKAKCVYCCSPALCCSLNYCCWPKLKPRTYLQVQENRIEYNFPFALLCGCGKCCIYDCVNVKYYDDRLFEDDFKRARCGSPFHACCVFEPSGQVLYNTTGGVCGFAWCYYLWPCHLCSGCGPVGTCCPACVWAVAGLEDAEEVARYANQANEDTKPGAIAVPVPSPRSARSPRSQSMN